MERIFSSAPLFFGATKDSPTTVSARITMLDDVDGALMREAVQEAILRYPYLSVRAELEDGWYVLKENTAPIPVLESREPIPLGGAEADGHLIAVRYFGRELEFELFHGLTDGCGNIRFMKTVFYYYCSKKYGVLLDRDGVFLKEDPIPEEEINDPYPDAVSDEIVPEGRYVHKGAVQLFPEGTNGMWHSVIKLPEDAFLRFSKQSDGSPAVMTALLMARAVRVVLGETEKPIVCGMAMDMRPVLKKPMAHHSVVSQLFLEYGKKQEKLELSHQATVFRGMVILQSQPENILTSVRNNIGFIKKLENLPDLAARKEFMRGVVARSMYADTFKVSYAGSHSMGAADKYIETCNPFIDIKGAGIMLEVSAINGHFDINFLQESDDEKYLSAFLHQLEEVGISYTAGLLKPFTVPNVDFAGVGGEEG